MVYRASRRSSFAEAAQLDLSSFQRDDAVAAARLASSELSGRNDEIGQRVRQAGPGLRPDIVIEPRQSVQRERYRMREAHIDESVLLARAVQPYTDGRPQPPVRSDRHDRVVRMALPAKAQHGVHVGLQVLEAHTSGWHVEVPQGLLLVGSLLLTFPRPVRSLHEVGG